MILQWPPQSSHTKVIDRTLGLYQHGPPPKAGTNEKWPPPTVKNPWDKSFIPKEFPTTHKIPSALPKRWDLHSTSPLMLRPPLSTAVPEVPDAAISKSSSWLEAFAARAAHTATMSATSIVSVYNFQQKVLEFLRDSAARNNIQNDISVIDDLFQRANSMALEAHIMAHDSGVTATELFTHLHMLRRRSVLEDPTVSLPQRDKDRLLVMEVGGQDLFGPNARQVHEWKRDTDEENVKLIARVFDERNQRDKTKKKPASSESHPPRSMDHRSPLAGLSRPKPKDSYSQKPGQSFRRQPKQSPYKARSGNQSRPQNYNRDRPNVSSTSNLNDSRDQGQRRQEKDPKGPSSNRPFNRKGRGGGSGQGRKWDRSASSWGEARSFHRNLDTTFSPTLRNSEESFKRYLNSLRRRPSTPPPSSTGVTQQQQSSRPSTRCAEAPSLPGHRGGSGHDVAGLLQPPFPSAEAGWYLPSHNRLKETQPVYCRPFIQDGDPLFDNSSSSTQRVDNEDRFEGRIPSYPGTRQHQEILPVCRSRNSLPIPGPPIWTFNGSERVHQDPSSCCSSLTFSRHPGTCISGRLDHPCFIQRTESSSYSTSPTTSSVTGMDNKLGKINVTALPNSGLSGPPLQLRTSPNISSGLVLTYSHRSPLPSISVDSHVCSQGFIHYQPDVTLCPIYNQWPSSSTFPPTLVQRTMDSTSSVMGHSNPAGFGIPLSVLPKVFWAPVLRTSGSWNLPVQMEGSLVRNFNNYYVLLIHVFDGCSNRFDLCDHFNLVCCCPSPVLISDKRSCWKISQSLKPIWLDVEMLVPLFKKINQCCRDACQISEQLEDSKRLSEKLRQDFLSHIESAPRPVHCSANSSLIVLDK